jgi:iron complex transport system substrate-binding protein
MNTEKVAALKPDLIVAEWWPLEKAYSGFEANTGGNTAPVLALAPIVGITQGNSVVTMIEDYGRLAASLGVDLGDPVLAARKAEFEQALAAFKAAIAAKPGLSVLAVWAGTDALYVAEGPPRPDRDPGAGRRRVRPRLPHYSRSGIGIADGRTAGETGTGKHVGKFT